MADKKTSTPKAENSMDFNTLNQKLDTITRNQGIIIDYLKDKTVSKAEFNESMTQIRDIESKINANVEILASGVKKEVEEAKQKKAKVNLDKLNEISFSIPKKVAAGKAKAGQPPAEPSLRVDSKIYQKMFMQAAQASKKWPPMLGEIIKKRVIAAFKDVGIAGFAEADFNKSFENFLKEVNGYPLLKLDVLQTRISDKKTGVKPLLDTAMLKNSYTNEKKPEETKKLKDAYEKFHADFIKIYLTKIEMKDGAKVPVEPKEDKITIKFEESKLYDSLSAKCPIAEQDKPAVAAPVEAPAKEEPTEDDSEPAKIQGDGDDI